MQCPVLEGTPGKPPFLWQRRGFDTVTSGPLNHRKGVRASSLPRDAVTAAPRDAPLCDLARMLHEGLNIMPPRTATQTASLRVGPSHGSEQLAAIRDTQPGKSPSPDDRPRALRSGPPHVTSSALVSGRKRGDLEGRGRACSRSALSGHFEITEQMEK